MPHGRRPALDARCPVHVTLRVARGLPSMRCQVSIAAARRAFAAGRGGEGFRLVHYAIQADHLHLLIEADDARALTRGMRGLSIRLARAVNRVFRRRGRVIAERYHARSLGTPREVRRALAYVLLQTRRHARQKGVGMTTAFDPCSSALVFDGWTRGSPREGPWTATVVQARTWLLSKGWRMHGLIDPSEIPG